jgi:hypothetical protein
MRRALRADGVRLFVQGTSICHASTGRRRRGARAIGGDHAANDWMVCRGNALDDERRPERQDRRDSQGMGESEEGTNRAVSDADADVDMRRSVQTTMALRGSVVRMPAMLAVTTIGGTAAMLNPTKRVEPFAANHRCGEEGKNAPCNTGMNTSHVQNHRSGNTAVRSSTIVAVGRVTVKYCSGGKTPSRTVRQDEAPTGSEEERLPRRVALSNPGLDTAGWQSAAAVEE